MMHKSGHPVATLPSEGGEYTSLFLLRNGLNSANHPYWASTTGPVSSGSICSVLNHKHKVIRADSSSIASLLDKPWSNF
eukprot:913085-Pleurochrysis_carterae.AAC.1